MMQEELPPYEEELDNNKLPLIIGIGLGLGAVALIMSGKDAPSQPSIKLVAIGNGCLNNQIWVEISWISTTLDLDFDVWSDRMLGEMHIEDTVRSNSWRSPMWPISLQGKVLTFKVSGKQTGIESPESKVTISMCDTTDKHVEGAEVLFS